MKDEEMESFLTTFERVMQAYEVPEDQRSLALAPQLASMAQYACAALNGELTADCKEVKTAILHRYDITEEIHCQKFHSTQKGVEESYVNLVIRLRDLASKRSRWCETREKGWNNL